MKRFVILTLLAAVLLSACSPAVAPPTTSPVAANRDVIVDVTVVDVEKGKAVPGQTVIVAGERIETIAATEAIEVPAGAEVIEGQGLYLMPGLVDAHVHFFDPEVFGRLMIASGVVLVRDMGMPTEDVLPLRDELDRGDVLGPEMVATGALLDGVPPLVPDISIGVATTEDGREAVRQQATAGVDMIKVYSRLEKDTFLAILDEAQKLGLKAVGHVPESIYIEEAAAAGLSSSEHLFGFGKVIAIHPQNLRGHGRGCRLPTASERGPGGGIAGRVPAAARERPDGVPYGGRVQDRNPTRRNHGRRLCRERIHIADGVGHLDQPVVAAEPAAGCVVAELGADGPPVARGPHSADGGH